MNTGQEFMIKQLSHQVQWLQERQSGLEKRNEELTRKVERLERRQSPVSKLGESFKALSKDGVIKQFEQAQREFWD